MESGNIVHQRNNLFQAFVHLFLLRKLKNKQNRVIPNRCFW